MFNSNNIRFLSLTIVTDNDYPVYTYIFLEEQCNFILG